MYLNINFAVDILPLVDLQGNDVMIMKKKMLGLAFGFLHLCKEIKRIGKDENHA